MLSIVDLLSLFISSMKTDQIALSLAVWPAIFLNMILVGSVFKISLKHIDRLISLRNCVMTFEHYLIAVKRCGRLLAFRKNLVTELLAAPANYESQLKQLLEPIDSSITDICKDIPGNFELRIQNNNSVQVRNWTFVHHDSKHQIGVVYGDFLSHDRIHNASCSDSITTNNTN